MPIPASINDLSTTAGSNSPAGSESPALIDDYLRTYASYIAQLRDGYAEFGHGQCRLSVASPTSLLLSPRNGRNMIVNGLRLQIPQAGITLSNTGLAPNTLYYAYLSGTTASPALNLSTTSHVTGVNGVEVKIGDATQTLVGMIFTSGSSPGQFVDSVTQRFCLNWFGRRDITASTNGAGLGITSGSEVSASLRNYFLCWGDEYTKSIVSGELAGSSAESRGDLVIIVDNTAPLSQPAGFGRTTGTTFAAGTYVVALTVQGRALLSEGLHYVTAYSYVTSGTGNYSNIFVDTDIRG